MPLGGVALDLQGEHEDVNVVITSKDVFVGVDDSRGCEGGAKGVHAIAGEKLASQNVVKTVQSALRGEAALLLKIEVLLHTNQ